MKPHANSFTLSTLAVIIFTSWILAGANVAFASPRQNILADYAARVKIQTPGFEGFSTDRGKKLFLSKPGTGKPDIPSCTTCHSNNPANPGQTRAGKAIEPMAVSRSPARYTDFKKLPEMYFTGVILISKFGQNIKDWNIEYPDWNFLNRLKRQPDKSSYFYWFKTVELLTTKQA